MGNAASSLPYSIGKQVSTVNHGWQLHEGSRKSDSAAVSVFTAKKPTLSKTPIDRRSPNMKQLLPALHHFHNCKKLRYPHILQVYATLDTDNPSDTLGTGSSHPHPSGGGGGSSSKPETGDLIIVTEPCIPLDAWLQTSPPPEQLAWGLEAIVRALHFMHSTANEAHGNLSPESFFVTPAGDVKLWNFSLVTNVAQASGGLSRHFLDWEALITPMPYRSPERQEGRWDAIAATGPHAMDSYGLGVLIGHFFNGTIPPPLVKAVQRMQTPNIRMRPRLQPLLKCPLFDTPYQKLQLQLEEFTVQPVEQKIAFWQNLTPNMQAGLIPENLAVHKLFPMMKTSITTICQSDSMRSQDLYRRELASMMPPLFFIAENYLGDSIGDEITPLVALLFGIADRGIRGALLQKASLFADNMNKQSLNQSVFEPMCSGFSDSSAALRELTLKATSVLVPHLTQPNLDKLSRYLVRLQSDSEASIRTNTVIFFSKLAPHLTDTSREKLLLPAFIRAMKDPFTPCRLAALKSTLKAKEFFDPQGIARQVFPVVTPQLLDSAAEVRKEAFAVVDDLLFLLRQESERMIEEEANQPVAATTGAPATATPVTGGARPHAHPPAPSSGGYLSGISSWVTSSTHASSSQNPPPRPAPAVPAAPSTAPPMPPQRQQMVTTAPVVAPNMASLSVMDDFDDDDGWGDEDFLDTSSGGVKTTTAAPGWGDDDFLDTSSGGVKTTTAAPTGLVAPAATTASTGGGGNLFSAANEDDFFGSFDDKPAVKVARPLQKAKPKGKLSVPQKKTAVKPAVKPAVKKLAMDDEDGWDDF